MSDRRGRRAGKRLWTADEDAILRRDYPDTPTSVLAARLGRSVTSVYQRAHRTLGLRKSDAYLASPAACRLRRGDNVGAATRFRKGQVPPNKGVRRPGWGPGRMKATQFKRGETNRKWMPVGSERLIDGYVYVKVSDVRGTKEHQVPYSVNWKPKHVLLWMAAHGPVPDGHALRFKDGDRSHIALENLELISRAGLMRRNTIHQLPKPLADTIRLIGALTRQIRRRERAQEQDQ